MNVVIVNTSERTGGAAIAANRLMNALQKSGIDTSMLVLNKQTDDENIASVQESFVDKWLAKWNFLWERLTIFVQNGFNRKDLFRVSIANTGFDVSEHPLIRSADVIHIHWINQGFLSLNNIRKLTDLNKPIVWTMHDMWTGTGICHHARDCNHFQADCGNCFYLNSKDQNDLSSKTFKKKTTLLINPVFTFVGCSNWITNRVQQSAINRNRQLRSIPNPINTEIFKQKDKQEARNRFQLPQDKKLILFGAVNVSDERKGLSYLIKSIQFIQQNNPQLYENLALLVLGQIKDENRDLFSLPVRTVGLLSNMNDIASLYNASDVFVTPSLEENLPNTIMESMACGTPCVGFSVGGIPEMIDHLHNGYVAEYENPVDLAAGIENVLDEKNHSTYSSKARKKVEVTYEKSVVAEQYIALYKSLLESNR